MTCRCHISGLGEGPSVTAGQFVLALRSVDESLQRRLLDLLGRDQQVVVHDAIVEMMEDPGISGFGDMGSWLSSLLGKAKDAIGSVASGAGKLLQQVAPLASTIPIIGPAVSGILGAGGAIATGASGGQLQTQMIQQPGAGVMYASPGVVPPAVKASPMFKIDQRTLLVIGGLGLVFLLRSKR